MRERHAAAVVVIKEKSLVVDGFFIVLEFFRRCEGNRAHFFGKNRFLKKLDNFFKILKKI